MKRFYENKGEYWIIKKGVFGFIMLRLTKYPDHFFRTWFTAIPAFCIGAALTGFLQDFTPQWARTQIVLLVFFIWILTLVSLYETFELFVRLLEDGHLKIVKKEEL